MTGFTEQRAFDYLPRSQPLQVSTENGGTTRLTHGPEAMDDCSVRTVELGGGCRPTRYFDGLYTRQGI